MTISVDEDRESISFKKILNYLLDVSVNTYCSGPISVQDHSLTMTGARNPILSINSQISIKFDHLHN